MSDRAFAVYRLKQDPDQFCAFTPVDQAYHRTYHLFDGTPVRAHWKEHVIRAADEEAIIDLPSARRP